jgi:hypothetical protein
MLFQTVVPHHNLFLPDGSIFQLSVDAWLAPIPDWLKNFRGIDHLSASDRDAFALCKYGLILSHEAEDFTDPTSEKAQIARAKLADRAYLANLALWLQPVYLVGFNFLFHATVSHGLHTPLLETPGRHEEFLYHFNDGLSKVLRYENWSQRETFTLVFARFRETLPLWVACRALTSALQMNHIEIRHLLLSVALEALFGSEGSEITFRLSQGLAFFISSDSAEAIKIFKEAKAGYRTRCQIAHGDWKPTTNDYRKEASVLVAATECFVRRSFTKLLSDKEIAKKFCGKERRDYLEGLRFTKGLPTFAADQNLEGKKSDGGISE